MNNGESLIVNGEKLILGSKLNCKDKYVIYVAQCKICSNSKYNIKEDTYFGQTVSPFHIRMNGHRNAFVLDEKRYEKSALSMHCALFHKEQFGLHLFKLGIVKKVLPCNLDREESRYIMKFRTRIWGMNRIKVTR